MAILYCGNLISNAFGGLLAAGILNSMEGKLGYAAWRWLFIIEGAITIAVAILSIFILPDFPSNTRWLSPLERRLAEVRLTEDVGAANDEGEKQGQVHGLKLAVSDWKVWWLALALTAYVVGLSFNAYFPTLAATLGYSRTITLLLCAPPWAFATLVGFINARHSDKTKERFFHVVIPMLVGIAGFIIALATMRTAARYVALFLMAQSYAGFIVFLSWISNSIPNPPAKRAVALALINAVSQLGNVAGSYVWPSVWGPTYRKSYGICIANFGVGIIMSLIFRQHLVSLNARLDNGKDVGLGDNMMEPATPVEEGVEQSGKRAGGKTISASQGFRFVY